MGKLPNSPDLVPAVNTSPLSQLPPFRKTQVGGKGYVCTAEEEKNKRDASSAGMDLDRWVVVDFEKVLFCLLLFSQ